ncbi:hypothetical protein MLD38_006914 [Melastoma candidum]|uniref:Uncharacterized protein n=1 Tax=Melastoma candidum TaxID=119954 RepID=A0ACB9RNN4_9MYRT|nr:hypothetical protein MLD38_006914 [Melastoma candidum]
MGQTAGPPRDGNRLEDLGYYHPLPGKDGGKRMGLNFGRVKYWLSVCAQPLDPVQNPLFRARVFPPPSILAMGHEGGPRDMRPVDPLTGRVITDKAATNAAVASALDNLNVLKFQFTATSA